MRKTLTYMKLCLAPAVLSSACGGSGKMPEAPEHAGTAEQLAGSSWTTSGGTLEFLPGSALRFMPKGGNSPLPVPPQPLEGSYTVHEGIVRASVANTMPFVGTWDGEKLVIGGEECVRVTPP